MIHFFHYARWNVKVAKSKVRMRNETKLMARASFEGVTFWKGLGRERFLWVWFWMHILRKGARTEVVCKRTIWCREEKESANWRFRNEKTWRKNWALEWSGWKEKIWKSKRRRRNLLILTRLETRAKELSNGASRQGRETLRTKRNREEWNQVEGGGEEQKKKFGKRLENSFDGSFWWYCWRKEKTVRGARIEKRLELASWGLKLWKNWFQPKSLRFSVCPLWTDEIPNRSLIWQTRKMVNFGSEGWSQGKPWWRLAEVLTCKSLFRHC